MSYNVFEFVNGMRDCRNGVPHKEGMGESYDAGYSSQYQLEQLECARV